MKNISKFEWKKKNDQNLYMKKKLSKFKWGNEIYYETWNGGVGEKCKLLLDFKQPLPTDKKYYKDACASRQLEGWAMTIRL